MKDLLKVLGVLMASYVIATVSVILLNIATTDRDPAFRPYQTTWAGQPAFGKLHRNGWYTFYRVDRVSGVASIGDPIATFPAGEAAKLH